MTALEIGWLSAPLLLHLQVQQLPLPLLQDYPHKHLSI
jgi:hypothetical protein